MGADSLSQHLVVKFSKHLELCNLILGEVRPVVGCRLGGFDLLNPPASGSNVGTKSGLTKSPCPQVISVEWGLVSGRRLFYLLDDQSKDKI